MALTSGSAVPLSGPGQAGHRWRTAGIGLAALLAVGLAATGCTSSGTAGGGEEGTRTLIVTSFGGSFETAQKEVLIPEFEKRYNAKVELTTLLSAPALAKLKAQGANSGFDVVQFSGGQEVEAGTLNLIAPVDAAAVPNAANMVEQAKRGQFAPAFALNSTGIIYNTEKVTPAPTSWNDLYDAKYKGRVGLPDISNTSGLNTLYMLNQVNGGSGTDMKPGYDALRRLMPNLHSVYRDGATMTQLLGDGTIDMAVFDSGYAYLLRQQGQKVGFVLPEDGSLVYGLTMNVVAGSKNADLAQKLIDLALEPEIQVAFAKAAGYVPTNTGATLPADLAETLPVRSEIERLSVADGAVVSANRAAWTEEWNKIVAK
ncbi:ABC transporter substrate-binding protein [Phytohabitans suffuscus]|uniref:ABC transporter substrate-binding protein n=1 Tax=Phytohabitans suffuscus TaxID=624315 RepID=A0A6F8Z1N9_9ACTN|nr:ABC transporter substrate-binding protein [Phytohabitans suffuscus]BCB92088.1 hypothetical protein Psuf_094010 [Phytohabitans suffuscus]